jgi:hypothetical protein
MRLSRHAKNELRRLGATRQEVESVVRSPLGKDIEWRGNPRYLGVIAGRLVRVVVAQDDPDVVITVYEMRRR